MDEGDDERCKVLTNAIANLRRQAAEVRTHATVVTEASRYTRSVAVAEARLAEKKKRSQRVMTSAKYAVCHIVLAAREHAATRLGCAETRWSQAVRDAAERTAKVAQARALREGPSRPSVAGGPVVDRALVLGKRNSVLFLNAKLV
jgi:hypothetical protein